MSLAPAVELAVAGVPGRSDPTAAQLRIALGAAADAAGVGLEPQRLSATADAGARMRWTPPAATLARVLGRVGLRCRMAAGDGRVPGPGPAMGVMLGPIPLLVLSRGRFGRRFHVVEVVPDGRQTLRLSPRALSARYGAGAMTWLQLEPALPLESVRVTPQHGPRSPWSRARAFLKLDRNDLGVVLVYALAVGGLSLATPVAVQALVNTVAFGTTLQPVVVLTLLLAVGLGLSALLRAFQAVVVEVVQQRLFVRVVTDLARRLPRVELSALQHRDGRELANRFFEVLTIQKALATLLTDGLGLVLQTLVGLALLAFYHPLLLAFDLVLVLLLVLVIFVLGRGAVRSALEESAAKYATAAWVETLAARPLLFKTGHGPDQAARTADALAHRYLDARRHHFRHLLQHTVGGLVIQVVAVTALLGLGGALVLGGQLTLGQLVAAELVVAALAGAFGKIGPMLEKVYDLVAGITKLGRLIDLPTERDDGEPLRGEGPARLRLHDGRAGEGGELHVPPGARVVLAGSDREVGRIIDAVTGLEPLPRGWIEIDGLDLRHVELTSLRRAVVLVRDAHSLPGTVLDNLRLGRPDLSVETAHELLRAVGLADAVARLPKGLDEPLLPGGHPLTDPQRRRLAVARALAVEPRLLVIDQILDGQLTRNDPVLDALTASDATLMVRSRDPLLLARCDQLIDSSPENPTA